MSQLPRVLVGIDFSAASERATVEASRLAREMGAQLDFVHICPLPPSSTNADPAAIERAHLALDTLEYESRARGFVAKSHLGVGNPVVGLCDYIRRLHPGLVVVGSHGRGGVRRLPVGSVAESLLRSVAVPVLVVPSAPAEQKDAWSCHHCGHFLVHGEPTDRCAQCHAAPPDWIVVARPAA